MDGRRRRNIQETFDLGLGFIGFFTAAFFAITLYFEITGRDAFWPAVTTVVLAMVLVAIWRVRRSALRQADHRGGR